MWKYEVTYHCEDTGALASTPHIESNKIWPSEHEDK